MTNIYERVLNLRQRNRLYFEMIEVLIKRIRELNEELENI